MNGICTTRGMSFDPSKAALERLHLKRAKRREQHEKAVLAEREQREQREQVRKCYQEHTPMQVKRARAEQAKALAKAAPKWECCVCEDRGCEFCPKVAEGEDVPTRDYVGLVRVSVEDFLDMLAAEGHDVPTRRITERVANFVRVELEACDPRNTPRLMIENRAAGL